MQISRAIDRISQLSFIILPRSEDDLAIYLYSDLFYAFCITFLRVHLAY